MGTERLKRLHNFTMPGGLRWGNTRQLRCMKVNSNGHRFSAAATTHEYPSLDQHHHRRTARERHPYPEFLNGSEQLRPTPSPPEEGDDGIASVREKVIFDLQTAADRMKDAILKEGLEEGEPQRPWNLRTRRAACKTLVRNSGGGSAAACGGGDLKGLKLDLPKPNSGYTQMRGTAAAGLEKSPLLGTRDDGGGSGAAAASGEKRERARFSVALSKKEIEEDFAVFGHRLPRRPKKRPKIVQKQLDTLFPGMWLTEVTPDMYKVPEAAP